MVLQDDWADEAGVPPNRTSKPLVALSRSTEDLSNWFWDNDSPFDQEANINKLAASLSTVANVLKVFDKSETKLFGVDGGEFKTFWRSTPSSYFYVPSQQRAAFISVSLHFIRETVHRDLALANTLAILLDGDLDGCVPNHGARLWDAEADDSRMWGLLENGLSGGRNWVHPVNIMSHERNVTDWWKSLSCETPAA